LTLAVMPDTEELAIMSSRGSGGAEPSKVISPRVRSKRLPANS
jgi:hypothetical protein